MSVFDRRVGGLGRYPGDAIRWEHRMITPAQCRAARGLLDWTQENLAFQASLGIVTIRQFEAGRIQPRKKTLEAIRSVFHFFCVKILDEGGNGGAGVRFEKRIVRRRK
jgi:transcriptional regulator with XRE-family HTH domain